MRRVLVIDDLRTFIDYEGDITYARSWQEGLQMLEMGVWDEVFLDHDLGLTGDIRPLIKWLVVCAEDNKPALVKQFYTCTDNPVGRDWIIGMLEPY